MDRVESRYQDLTGRVQRVQFMARTVQMAITEEARALSAYQAFRSARYQEEFNAAADQLETTLAEMERTMQVAEGKAILAQIMADSRAYREQADSYFRGTSVDSASIEALRAELVTNGDRLLAMGDQLAEQLREAAAASAVRAERIIMMAAAVAVAAGLAIGLILGGQIVRPVTAIARVASRMAEGDLTVEPVVVTNRASRRKTPTRSAPTSAREPAETRRPVSLRVSSHYSFVRISGPFSVIAIVCSYCTQIEPSTVRAVQPSGSSFVW